MINLERARQWLGRVDVRNDVAAPSPLATLYDLLGFAEAPPPVGSNLPELGHWLYFSSWSRLCDTNESGDYRDPALPPIELPRRLCVDCRVRIHRPIRVGDPISRLTRVVDVAEREGRAGPIAVVLLRHEVADFQGVAVSEERRLLYMVRGEEWPSSEPQHVRGAAEWSHEFRPDTRLLFRYSALTRNMSRVHYDRPFAVFANGYPGLVVQGELVSALLLAVARQQLQSERISSVDLRALRLLYDVEPVRIFGRRRVDREIEVWAEDREGRLAIEGLVGVQDASSTER